MPKLLDQSNDMETTGIPGLAGYNFSAVKIDNLGASEYTLVTILCDVSGSVGSFLDLLRTTMKTTVAACRKSPKANNILLRTVLFGSTVQELHGFKPLSEIDDTIYDSISTMGMTALHDAAATGIASMTAFARKLVDQDYGVNGILYILSDGGDNASTFPASVVADKAAEAVNGEVLESFTSVLVGVNARDCSQLLQDFQAKAGITQYLDAGDATPGNMAKLAGFISRSVSSTASAQGTGQAASLPPSITI